MLSSPRIGALFLLHSTTITNQIRSHNLLVQVSHYCKICIHKVTILTYRFHVMIDMRDYGMNLFCELITPLRAAVDRFLSGPFYYPNCTWRDVAFTHTINVDQKPGLSNIERVQDSPSAICCDCTKAKAKFDRICLTLLWHANS